jgi:hypothetical protein
VKQSSVRQQCLDEASQPHLARLPVKFIESVLDLAQQARRRVERQMQHCGRRCSDRHIEVRRI